MHEFVNVVIIRVICEIMNYAWKLTFYESIMGFHKKYQVSCRLSFLCGIHCPYLVALEIVLSFWFTELTVFMWCAPCNCGSFALYHPVLQGSSCDRCCRLGGWSWCSPVEMTSRSVWYSLKKRGTFVMWSIASVKLRQHIYNEMITWRQSCWSPVPRGLVVVATCSGCGRVGRKVV